MARVRNTPENFERHYQPEPNTGCWLWVERDGKNDRYGRLKWNGKHASAHRLSFEIHVGPIPEGMEIDHKCKTTFCVNPDHLEPVTRVVNNERSRSISSVNQKKTHCPQGHALSEIVIWGGVSQRICHTCRNTARRARRAAKRNK